MLQQYHVSLLPYGFACLGSTMLSTPPRFPEEQRSNLLAKLESALLRKMDEDDLSYDRAFSHVALETLGYDPEAGIMSDGKGDFGIDFWMVEERTATVFQFKSHDFTEGLNASMGADSKQLIDLPRIGNILS